MGVSAVMGVSALVLGVGLARLTSGAASLGAAPVAAAPETVPVETEIGDAVVATRRGPFQPAPVEHLMVVQVSVTVCGHRSVGTGFLVADGLLLTAAHVVGDAHLVRIDHGGVTVTGEVLGVFADGRDVALIEVDAPLAEMIVPRPAPAVGEPMTMVGRPDGGPRALSVGARVDLAPAVAATVAGETIGVAASVGVGFSGGPAVDAAGSLVGIVVATETATDTALVTPLADLGRFGEMAVVAGRCSTDA